MSERLGLINPNTVDVPRSHVRQGVFSDWDRTIGDVDVALKHLYSVADGHGVDVSDVKAIYRQSKQDGGSMEPLTIIQDKLAALPEPVGREQLRKQYIECAQAPGSASLLYPDAAGYVHRVRQANAPESVVTYGVNPEWQEDFKISGGYDGHVQTLPNSHKGPYLETLLSPEGTFDFYVVKNDIITDIVQAETAALVDDKVLSLENAPDNVTGWLLRRGNEEVLASQAGEWPVEQTVSSLGQLVMHEGLLVRADEPAPNWPTTMPRSDIKYVPIEYGVLAA